MGYTISEIGINKECRVLLSMVGDSSRCDRASMTMLLFLDQYIYDLVFVSYHMLKIALLLWCLILLCQYMTEATMISDNGESLFN